MKILEIFSSENRLEFIEKCNIIKIWWMISTEQVKLSKVPAKSCAFWPKWRELWKISRKFKDYLIKISMEYWLFSQFFTKYFLDFWLRSESIYLWKIMPDFYNNFSDFGGGRSGVPPLPTLLILETRYRKWASMTFSKETIR